MPDELGSRDGPSCAEVTVSDTGIHLSEMTFRDEGGKH